MGGGHPVRQQDPRRARAEAVVQLLERGPLLRAQRRERLGDERRKLAVCREDRVHRRHRTRPYFLPLQMCTENF